MRRQPQRKPASPDLNQRKAGLTHGSKTGHDDLQAFSWKRAEFPEPPKFEEAKALAEMAIRPSACAALVVQQYSSLSTDLAALDLVLEQAGASERMKEVEAMLINQARSLQSMFTYLARQAKGVGSLPAWEAHIRLAMKAQNQSRLTLETLVNLQRPHVVIAKQTNIANGGPQQVNVAVTSIDGVENELLGDRHGATLDGSAAGEAGASNQDLETLGARNWPQNGRGKGAGGSKR
jgi:hypothetical protein